MYGVYSGPMIGYFSHLHAQTFMVPRERPSCCLLSPKMCTIFIKKNLEICNAPTMWTTLS